MANLDITTSPLLKGAAHGFVGRQGGLSKGIYAGLNVGIGSDDEQAAILANRNLVRGAVFADSELVTVHQVHSADVITVTAPIALDARPEADAMVTNRPGLLLGILTADCVPVLLYDSKAQVIGAAHAGWKGAIGGVTDNMIAAMEKLGARRENMVCAIGPCIAQHSYEVDAQFRRRFLDVDKDNSQYFENGRAAHFQFDIESYVADRIVRSGIAQIEKLGLDTYANEDRYYSYRRSCHKEEAGYGRQISVIGLR